MLRKVVVVVYSVYLKISFGFEALALDLSPTKAFDTKANFGSEKLDRANGLRVEISVIRS